MSAKQFKTHQTGIGICTQHVNRVFARTQRHHACDVPVRNLIIGAIWDAVAQYCRLAKMGIVLEGKLNPAAVVDIVGPHTYRDRRILLKKQRVICPTGPHAGKSFVFIDDEDRLPKVLDYKWPDDVREVTDFLFSDDNPGLRDMAEMADLDLDIDAVRLRLYQLSSPDHRDELDEATTILLSDAQRRTGDQPDAELGAA